MGLAEHAVHSNTFWPEDRTKPAGENSTFEKRVTYPHASPAIVMVIVLQHI